MKIEIKIFRSNKRVKLHKTGIVTYRLEGSLDYHM